jgi:ATP-dependent helicase/nuclease subunit A
VKGEALGARGGEAELAGLERRVTGAYGHDAMTKRAAVVAVTALARDEEEEGGGAAVAAWVPSVEGGRAGLGGEEARLRGTATHRVLEKLDFTQVDRGALVAEAIEGLAARGIITAEEAKAADGAGIAWFLGTDVGQRVITAAKRVKALDRAVKLRREISFAWAGGDDAVTSAGDLQTVRGVIDVLIAEPGKARAEIVDYKTDSAWTWQGNVEGHRRQMGIYLRAASEILGFVVEKATLVFLGAREVVEVRGDESATQG